MIRLKNVSKSVTNNNRQINILKKINLDIERQDFICILGTSGSGKSTLLNIIGLLDSKFEGQYFFKNIRLENLTSQERANIRNSQVGFIFQNFSLIENMTVFQNIMLPLIYDKSVTKIDKTKIGNIIKRVGLVGLEGLEELSVKVLSGGQRQRVSIARALVNNPKFIIADEPTGSLDSVTAKEIMNLFIELNREGTTIILVTHDENNIQYCNKVFRLLDGYLLC